MDVVGLEGSLTNASPNGCKTWSVLPDGMLDDGRGQAAQPADMKAPHDVVVAEALPPQPGFPHPEEAGAGTAELPTTDNTLTETPLPDNRPEQVAGASEKAPAVIAAENLPPETRPEQETGAAVVCEVHEAKSLDAALPVDPLAAALPEDAPPGHEAYSKVDSHASHKWPYAAFQYGPRKSKFQATVGKSGSLENALRVARACYMRFELGDTLEQVKEFRSACYEKIRMAQAKPSSTVNTSKEESVVNGDGAPRSSSAVLPAAGALDVQAPASVPKGKVIASCAIEEDAPEGSKAHDPSKMQIDNSNGVVFFTYSSPVKSKHKFTVKISKCNSLGLAMRVARLCFAKLESGVSTKEAQLYREELYGRVALTTEAAQKERGSHKWKVLEPIAEEGAKKEKKRKWNVPEQLENGGSKKDNKKRKGAVQSEEAESKAARTERSLLDAPADSMAHQKVHLRSEEGSGTCVFSFLQPDGQRVRFQTTASAANGSVEDALRIARLCYAKLEAGCSKTELDRYRQELYAACKEDSKAAARKAAKATARGSAGNKSGHARPDGSNSRDAAASSSSGSSSSSSDSGDESDSSASAAPAAKRQVVAPAQALAAVQAPGQAPGQATRLPRAPPHQRVCAKMMVRAGLRCGCHFALRCPASRHSEPSVSLGGHSAAPVGGTLRAAAGAKTVN